MSTTKTVYAIHAAVAIRSLHAANERNQATITTLEARIKELEEWIEIEGVRNDTCTLDILGRVCEGCRCGGRSKR